MYFHYGLWELSRGKHPDCSDWRITRKDPVLYRGAEPSNLGPVPHFRAWPSANQHTLAAVLAKASLSKISGFAEFPDWLGYMGLGLLYTEAVERRSRILTQAWIPQLLDMLPPPSSSRPQLELIQDDPNRVFTWGCLETVESDLVGGLGSASTY